MQVIDKLIWDAERVGLLMVSNGIRSRSALAKTLDISPHTVTDAFSAHWQGRATAYLIAVMCSHFKVCIADIVQEPLLVIRRMNNVNSGHTHRFPNTVSH